jgi:hypothetical protein
LSRHDGSCESQEGFHRGRSYEPSCDAAGQDCVDSIDLAALAEAGVVGIVRGTTKMSCMLTEDRNTNCAIQQIRETATTPRRMIALQSQEYQ